MRPLLPFLPKNPLCGVPGDASARGTRTQADAAGAADEVRQLTRLLEEKTAKTKALEDEVRWCPYTGRLTSCLLCHAGLLTDNAACR